jgi:hypothetical protein
MNVLDFPNSTLPDTDYLKAIFERQKELMEKYEEIERKNGAITIPPEEWGELDLRRTQYRIKDLMQRCVEELGEAMNCLKLKPWKQSDVPTDATHFYEEVADAFHFFIELCITAGMDADDLALMYLKKSEVNKFRQRSNY